MSLKNIEFQFKKCTEEDIERICELQEIAFLHLDNTDLLRRNSREMLENCLREPHYTIGAFHEDVLAAFCILYDGENTSENIGKDIGIADSELRLVANIKLVIVLPQYRGNGLQQKLISFLEKVAVEKGKKILCATVSPDNTVSIKNFEAVGFEFHSSKVKYGGLRRNIYLKSI